MKRKRILVSTLVVCLFVIIAGVLLVLTKHFNPLTGVYTYNPRTDQPSGLILANRPDIVFLDVLTKQIEKEGTYPPNAAAKVVKVKPIQVAVGTYTDWQAFAFVTTRFDYADGTSRVEEFSFHSVGSKGAWLPIVGEIAYYNYYARLIGCNEIPDEPGKSTCVIQ